MHSLQLLVVCLVPLLLLHEPLVTILLLLM